VSLEHLKQSLYDSPIIKKGEYYYIIHPITDGVPMITPQLLKEVTDVMKKEIKKVGKIDRIVTMEAMGIPLASVLSLELGIPFTIIRKREYGLPGEVSVEQVTGYSKSKLYINGLRKGDQVVIVDDVLSTGGTLQAVLTVLQKIGVVVKGIYIAIDKGECKEKICSAYNVKLHTFIKITVDEGKLAIVEELKT
jgi:adenine phosphoribosyltransferase